MNYIVFDLEFNQDFTAKFDTDKKKKFPFEIIQIGAIKLDSDFNTISSFNRFIKPIIYNNVNQFITQLTGITTEQLSNEETFPDVYSSFIEFIGNTESVLCTWGMSDIKVLFKNVDILKLDSSLLTTDYINIQPYVSTFLGLPSKNLLQLRIATEILKIPITYNFHNAYYDAYYTAQIFKKIYKPSIKPKLYNPDSDFTTRPPRQQKQVVDYDKLLEQFKKMYNRDISEDEQSMILIAYKMGRTKQFVNVKDSL